MQKRARMHICENKDIPFIIYVVPFFSIFLQKSAIFFVFCLKKNTKNSFFLPFSAISATRAKRIQSPPRGIVFLNSAAKTWLKNPPLPHTTDTVSDSDAQITEGRIDVIYMW